MQIYDIGDTMSDKNLVVDAFIYADEEVFAVAEKEKKAIDYLSKQLGNANEKQIKELYIKLVTENFFKTENGVTFLYLLRENLVNVYHVSEKEIPPIPVTKTPDSKLKVLKYDCETRVKAAEEKLKKFKERFYITTVLSVVLLLVVVGMFVVLKTSDSPTIINYKTKIENQYSDWEQDLKDRETIIRQKELELNIKNDD
jgi:hypothetical protein